METNTLSYSEVIDHFGQDTIRDRYRFLFEKMQTYISERNLSDYLWISEKILQQLVMDYFTDMFRLQHFHKIVNPNKAKILAYQIYWILRRKPIQVKSSEDELSSEGSRIVFPNEGFATTLVSTEFLMPKETIPLSGKEEETFFMFLDHLHYYFKYRNVDKQNLELILYSFYVGNVLSPKTVL